MNSCLRGLLARGFSPRHVIDVGASHGPWSLAASKLWPGAHYTLFEPLAEHAPKLDALCAENPNFSWFPCALGREKTRLPISIYPGNLDIASLAYAGPESRHVPVERLDNLVTDGRLFPADLIKIDVQGFEPDVLQGADNTVQQAAVAIIETYFHRFSPHMMLIHELVALMHRYGFRVYEFVDPLARPLDQAMGQCDVCFVREDHALLQDNRWS